MTVYDQVTLNCNFKSRIHAEFSEWNSLYAKMKEIFEANMVLKVRIKAPPKIVYKVVKGDEIDVMFGEAM
jgi:hypothetical protein